MASARRKRAALNEAARTLRNQADRDYICARHLYPLGFADQFMSQSHQALEKYLKATILFGVALPYEGGISLPKLRGKRGYGHDISSLLADVKKLEPWHPEVPDPVCEFVGHVHEVGLNRYSDQHAHRLGDELPRLDEAVWHIRRWCQYSSREPGKRLSPAITQERWVQVQREHILRVRAGCSQLIGGLLESIIARGRRGIWREARSALLKWNRWFFDKRRSGAMPPSWSSSSVPVWDRAWAKPREIAQLFADIGIGPRVE
jgi:hypothetical protein